MKLLELIQPLVNVQIIGEGNPDILRIMADSRSVQPGDLFVAIRGFTVDGHQFIEQAIQRGAAAVLVEEVQGELTVPQIVVPDTRRYSAILATLVYNHPGERISVIGVTGTNGKTTTTQLIARILETVGWKVGVIGTIGIRIGHQQLETSNTTPDAVSLQKILFDMAAADCRYAIMEVSSHALEEGRVAGIPYHMAVFTNLTQDHLDYHQTMEAYRAAKGKLFSRLGNTFSSSRLQSAYAILNADDASSEIYARDTVQEVITYGIEKNADIRATHLRILPEGARFRVESSIFGHSEVVLSITGRFNVYNALAALTVACVEGVSLEEAAQALSSVAGVPGRLEPVVAGQPFTVLVDYAHTPDSLENALSTIQEFAQKRIITVVGCGGDRDRTKRPLMAGIAVQKGDYTILTSDNPRTEDPESILDDMERGIPKEERQSYERVVDRRTAIERAVAMAEAGDVILIAGKGHEDYQILGRKKIHFDDREVAREAIQRLLETRE